MRYASFCVLGLGLSLALSGPASAVELPPREAGTVVSVDDSVYTVDLGEESGVAPGSILQVYRFEQRADVQLLRKRP